jgi:hypothetical protein
LAAAERAVGLAAVERAVDFAAVEREDDFAAVERAVVLAAVEREAGFAAVLRVAVFAAVARVALVAVPRAVVAAAVRLAGRTAAEREAGLAAALRVAGLAAVLRVAGLVAAERGDGVAVPRVLLAAAVRAVPVPRVAAVARAGAFVAAVRVVLFAAVLPVEVLAEVLLAGDFAAALRVSPAGRVREVAAAVRLAVVPRLLLLAAERADGERGEEERDDAEREFDPEAAFAVSTTAFAAVPSTTSAVPSITSAVPRTALAAAPNAPSAAEVRRDRAGCAAEDRDAGARPAPAARPVADARPAPPAGGLAALLRAEAAPVDDRELRAVTFVAVFRAPAVTERVDAAAISCLLGGQIVRINVNSGHKPRQYATPESKRQKLSRSPSARPPHPISRFAAARDRARAPLRPKWSTAPAGTSPGRRHRRSRPGNAEGTRNTVPRRSQSCNYCAGRPAVAPPDR